MERINFTLTEEQKRKINRLKKMYFQAKTLDEMLLSEMKKIKTKVLLENNYQICDEMLDITNETDRKITETDRRITDPENDYLMDSDIFINDYLAKCYELECEFEIANPKGKDYSANAEAHNMMLETEAQLVNLAIAIIPFEQEKNYLKNLKHIGNIVRKYLT